MIKLVIYDFDGLVVDSEPIYVSSNKRFLTERGITDFSIFDRIFGMRAEETFQLMKKEFNLEGSVEELMNIRNSYILEDFDNGKLKLMPYLKETLETLSKSNYLQAVGSSSKKVLLEKGIEIHGIGEYFKTIVCGDDVVKGKPEPDIFLKVAQYFDMPAKDCVVLEDSPNGILAAKNAGMISVAIPNDQTKDLDFYEPDYKLKNLKEFSDLLLDINKG